MLDTERIPCLGLSPDGSVLFANEAACRLIGCAGDDLRKLSAEELDPSWSGEGPGAAAWRSVRTGAPGKVVTELRRKDGTRLPVEILATAVESGDGEVLFAFPIDLTEHRRDEHELRYRLAFGDLISEIASRYINLPADQIDSRIARTLELVGAFSGVDAVGLYRLSPGDGTFLRTAGWIRRKELSGAGEADRTDESELSLSAAMLRKGRSSAVPDATNPPREAAEECAHLRSRGVRAVARAPMLVEHDLRGFIELLTVDQPREWSRDELHMFEFLATILSSALARKESEAELRGRENRYRAIVEDQTEFVVRWLPDGTRTFVNDSYCRYFQQSREELVGTSFFPLIAPADREAVRERLSRLSSDNPVSNDEHRVIRPDGSQGWQSWTDRAIFDTRGRIVECQSVGRDITDRRRAEEDLREAMREVARLKEQLEEENVYLREEVERIQGFEGIVGESHAILEIIRTVKQVAPTDAGVLILGETGTGKDRIARAVHSHSPRAGRPFVKVDCAALTGSLIESALFGHEKGAFTSAVTRSTGRFELAHGGTVFLDEIGELPLELQSKLLRVLETGEFERLGSPRTIRTDVRVIAATNRDLRNAVAAGSFRSDLFYRLNVFPIEVPPLRARREDIPLLVWHFLTISTEKLRKRIRAVPDDVMEALCEYDWPGNARELQNVIERAVILSPGTTLRVGPSTLQPAARPPSLRGTERLRDLEREHILQVLRESGWRVRGAGNAADRLGMNPSTLRSRMKKLGIQRPQQAQAGQGR